MKIIFLKKLLLTNKVLIHFLEIYNDQILLSIMHWNINDMTTLE
jgi:hypothetical protein